MKNKTRNEVMIKKAVMLTDVTGCKLEKVLIYLVMCKSGKEIDVNIESRVPRLPIELIKRLDGANLWDVLI